MRLFLLILKDDSPIQFQEGRDLKRQNFETVFFFLCDELFHAYLCSCPIPHPAGISSIAKTHNLWQNARPKTEFHEWALWWAGTPHTTLLLPSPSVVLHSMRHHSSGQWQTWCQQRHIWPNKSHHCFSWFMPQIQTLSCCPTLSQCTLVLLSGSSAYLSHRFLHCTEDVLLCATVFNSSLASFSKFMCRPNVDQNEGGNLTRLSTLQKEMAAAPNWQRKPNDGRKKVYYTHCTDEES